MSCFHYYQIIRLPLTSLLNQILDVDRLNSCYPNSVFLVGTDTVNVDSKIELHIKEIRIEPLNMTQEKLRTVTLLEADNKYNTKDVSKESDLLKI